jgi:hypothetical protein
MLIGRCAHGSRKCQLIATVLLWAEFGALQ